MLRILSVLCAFALLAASGITHRRWATSSEAGALAQRLEKNAPLIIGDWEGTPLTIDQRQLDYAEVMGSLSRRYVQRRTGHEVSVFLVCGRPGPIAVHTPDVCYGGAGYQIVGRKNRCKVEEGDSQGAEFIWADMRKPGTVSADQLRIYWAWNAGQGWQAPTWPRLMFGGRSALCKIYLIYRPAPGTKMPEQDPCREFMRDVLPQLHQTLFP